MTCGPCGLFFHTGMPHRKIKMAEKQLIFNEDGFLNVDAEVKEILYHPYLNVILICTYNGVVKVLDVNSGVILQSSDPSAQNLTEVKCKYISTLDRVLFIDGQVLGVRSDYNGVLLLDSVPQKIVSDGQPRISAIWESDFGFS